MCFAKVALLTIILTAGWSSPPRENLRSNSHSVQLRLEIDRRTIRAGQSARVLVYVVNDTGKTIYVKSPLDLTTNSWGGINLEFHGPSSEALIVSDDSLSNSPPDIEKAIVEHFSKLHPDSVLGSQTRISDFPRVPGRYRVIAKYHPPRLSDKLVTQASNIGVSFLDYPITSNEVTVIIQK